MKTILPSWITISFAVLWACSGGPPPVGGGGASGGAMGTGGAGGGGGEQGTLVCAPLTLDFGMVTVGVPLIRSFTCVNHGVEPLAVRTVHSDNSRFRPSLRSNPDLSEGDGAGFTDAFTVDVTFDPDVEGREWGTIAIESTGRSVHLDVMPVSGFGRRPPFPAFLQVDTFRMRGPPKADLLWVIDNSTAMAPHQQRVLDHLEAFLDHLRANGTDFRLAVTTTGLEPAEDCSGAAGGGEDGRFHPIDGAHRILAPNTGDLLERWRDNVDVGACQESAYPFEAASRALSEPLILQTKDSRYDTSWDDGNAGFLRSDASLSIIFVSARDDASTAWGRSLDDYVDSFLDIKGRRNSNMLEIHAIAGARQGSSSPGCTAAPAERLGAAADATDGLWLDLCELSVDATEWAAHFVAPFVFTQRFALRERPGDSNDDGAVDELDLQLKVDDVPVQAQLPSGARVWSYDPLSNAIDFSPLHIPRPDSEISVSYRRLCLGK